MRELQLPRAGASSASVLFRIETAFAYAPTRCELGEAPRRSASSTGTRRFVDSVSASPSRRNTRRVSRHRARGLLDVLEHLGRAAGPRTSSCGTSRSTCTRCGCTRRSRGAGTSAPRTAAGRRARGSASLLSSPRGGFALEGAELLVELLLVVRRRPSAPSTTTRARWSPPLIAVAAQAKQRAAAAYRAES